MITKVTPETLKRQRTGKNYWTIPGCEAQITEDNNPETLEKCIQRVFDVCNIEERTRKKEVVYARHMKRFVLEKLTDKNMIVMSPRKGSPKYRLCKLESLLDCDHTTILHSSRTAQNLIETDRDYRAKADIILSKIKKGLIIFP